MGHQFGDPTALKSFGGQPIDTYLAAHGVGVLVDTTTIKTRILEELAVLSVPGNEPALVEHAADRSELIGNPQPLDYYNRVLLLCYALEASSAETLTGAVCFSRKAAEAGESPAKLAAFPIPVLGGDAPIGLVEIDGALPASLLKIAADGTDEDDELLVSLDVTPSGDPEEDVTIVFSIFLVPTRRASQAERGKAFA